MALQLQDMLARLSPVGALRPMDGGGADDMQRQHLKLMREQFEEAKRRTEEEGRLANTLEEGRMRREQMQAQQQQAQAKAVQDAETLKLKREASVKFAESLGKGDIQGAHAQVPYMTQLGMSVDLDGEENGLPKYSVYMSPDDAAKGRRLDTLKEENPNPYLAEGEAPTPNKNKIDMPAMHAQVLKQLNPYLDAAQASYAEPYQASVGQSANAVRGLGLPLSESIKQFQESRQSPDSLIRADMQAQSAAGDQAARLAETQALHGQGRIKQGYELADGAGKDVNVKDVWERRRSVALARSVLTDDSTINDYMAGAGISRMMGERGSTTEQDVARVIGAGSASWIDQVRNGLFRNVVGGLSPEQRRSLLGILAKSQGEDDSRVFGLLDNLGEEENKPDTNPEVRQGINSWRTTHIPRDLRDEWEKRKKLKEPGQKPAAVKPFDMEEDSKAEHGVGLNQDFHTALNSEADANGVDAEKILPLINKESIGGDPAAANPLSSARGLIQMIDEVAKSYTNPRTGEKFKDADEITQLSAVEQAPIVAQYFKDKGVTKDSSAEDYAMAVAAPKFRGKPPETVVYPKDSEAWKANRPWRPADGGDITVKSILAFYGLPKAAKAGEVAQVDPNARMRELLKKSGG